MKTSITIILGATVTALLAGHATAAMVLAPVGPNPFGLRNPAASGQLQVFSALEGHSEGNDPAWFQHTGYYLYNSHGRLLRHVDNTVGYYARAPRLISLPAGKYLVKAQAKDAFWLEAPVVIKPGQTTDIHLDGDWRLPASTPKADLVSAPAGYPVGWRFPAPQMAGEN